MLLMMTMCRIRELNRYLFHTESEYYFVEIRIVIILYIKRIFLFDQEFVSEIFTTRKCMAQL